MLFAFAFATTAASLLLFAGSAFFYGNCNLTADNGKDLSLRSIVFLFFVLYVCKF